MTSHSETDVLVIGEALIDIVETGSWATEHVGGSPANVALGLGRRGVRVALLTQIADDLRGGGIVEHLEASGVEVLAESFTLRTTSTAVAHIAADGHAEYEFDVRWDALPEVTTRSPRVLHTGSIAAFLEPGAASVRRLLETSGAEHVTFDPNIRPALLPPHPDAVRMFEQTAVLADVVKMSDEDAAWLYPDRTPDAVIDAALALGPTIVAITLGGEGALLGSAEGRVRVPAPPVDAVDTIGAGDTFMASLIVSLMAEGADASSIEALERMGRSAVLAAAITVSRPGADLPWAREL
jgi:fructokinase